MNFHSHWLSDVLTMSSVALKKNWTTAEEINRIWSSPKMDGKLNLLCLNSPTCSCGVACLWKEVNWILRYTKNIPDSWKKFLSLLQRRNSYVELISSSTTYRSTCHLGQEQIVDISLLQSLLIDRNSVDLEVKFDNLIQGLQLWLVIEVSYHYHCYVDFLFKYNVRVATLIWTHLIHRSRSLWSNWTICSLFCIVLVLQTMLLGCLLILRLQSPRWLTVD